MRAEPWRPCNYGSACLVGDDSVRPGLSQSDSGKILGRSGSLSPPQHGMSRAHPYRSREIRYGQRSLRQHRDPGAICRPFQTLSYRVGDVMAWDQFCR